MEPLIELQHVTVRADDYEVLRDVSIAFAEGASTVMVGPSGCGKSTLLKVAAGLIVPDSGRVLLRGKSFLRLSEREELEFRRSNGFVFQDAALWANKSLFENLSLPLQLHNRKLGRRELERRVARLFSEMSFDNPPSLRPAQLSIGEQKIVCFLRATIAGPSLLFLDEPTTSVDHTAAQRMMHRIRELKEAGTTIIAVTHDAQLTAQIADRLVVLKEGSVLEQGSVRDVVGTRDRKVLAILSEIMSDAATYDTDILDLLADDGGAEN